ncbi:FliG C-terminal domain-containing protein [Treponema sp. UBA6852]|uniref:FliG C-terminal domain-containing protein n=1 Tax=Treponema sp. UBA6852 TaxID=1947744 RepID=UPI000E94BC8E|nr:FliG C-terminal domain-containing protein [Treponema sp. UBA6852]HBP09792.1 hypothetical protein [Treponema sp.]
MAIFYNLPPAKPEYEKTLLGMAWFLINTAERSRREGILSLQADMDTEQAFNDFAGEDFPQKISLYGRNFIRNLFMDICDGVEISDIEKIAFYAIASSQKLGGDEEKLALMMAAEGVHSIYEGANPRVLATKLASMIGEELGTKLMSDFEKRDDENRAEYLRRLEESSEQKEQRAHTAMEVYLSGNFENIVWLDDITVKKIAEENLDFLAQAIAFCDYEIQSKIFRCVSPETKKKLEAELLEMKKPSVECQKKIMDSLYCS